MTGLPRKSQTFSTWSAVEKWANDQIGNLEAARGTGRMPVSRSETIADLIRRYVEEFETSKGWGRSKSADLARLERDLGGESVRSLTTRAVVDYFRRRHAEGSGRVVISAQIGYLITVFKVAQSLWHLDAPLHVLEAARESLTANDLAGKSEERVRSVNGGRVLESEIRKLCDYFKKRDSSIPFTDIVQFAVASTMRLSEITRIEWRDFDAKAATVLIRDRKDPRKKDGNHQLVPLLPEALRIIKRQRRADDPRIFPFNDHSVGTLYARAVNVLELPDLTFHDLRHEACYRLFAKGLSIQHVAIISGHKDWKMLRRYTHLGAHDVHAALRAANGKRRAGR